MAANNTVIANVRVAVGGVEASKKNLDAIKASADALARTLEDLRKQQKALIDTGDLKGAAKVVEEIRKTETALKTSRQLVRSLEQELGNYEDIMENIAGATLQKLNTAARNLSNQMKQQLTADDIDRWKELSDAYKQVMRQIEQLNGKAPNLGYVMQNLGTVSKKSLEDTDTYLRRLIADADQGSSRIVDLQEKLKKVNAEQQARLQSGANDAIGNVSGGTFSGSTVEAKEAIATLQQYKETLNLSTQQVEIERVTQAMNVYNEAIGKVRDTAIDVSKVLSDPRSYSTEQIENAIKKLEEQAKNLKVGDASQISQVNEQIQMLQRTLSETQYEARGIDNIVQKARTGEATISEMENAVAALNDKLKRTPQNMTTEIEKIRKDLDILNPALEKTQIYTQRVQQTLNNINGANLGSLKEAAAALEKEMKSVSYNMDNFVADSARLKQAKERIKELEGAWSNTRTQMEKAIDRLKNWVLIYAGWQVVTDKMRQAVSDTLELSDSMADVQKTTGLAADEVARLTDQIQSLDTRVSNEKLMQAATEAGRIGLKTREDVFKFTKSSAIVLTALDELDARAITSVMKLNGLLGETARLGVDHAILSTASSINELSQASSAAAQPIIDFSRRYGGIASQAHISTAQVLALGATLDALGQPVEMSSTALNKFTTALLANSKQIAEDTGLSEEYVLQMIRQGKTIEVMIEVLSKLNSMGGIGEISKYMGDMGGDGARMAAVISALASNLNFLRSNLDLSNQAFEEGTSVINEYNVKNENAAALVQRMGNDIKEAFVNSAAVEFLTAILKGLQQFVHFMTSGSVAANIFNKVLLLFIARLLAAQKHISALNKSLKLLWGEMKAGVLFIRQGGLALISFSSIIGKARIGLVALKNVLKGILTSNPFGWVLIGISLLTDLVSAFGKTEDSIDSTANAVDEMNKKFYDEEYQLVKLKRQLDEARQAKKGYSEIISTLNRDYGEHIGYLLKESAGYREIAQAIKEASLARRIDILEMEKDDNYKRVRDKYREEVQDLSSDLKNQLAESFNTAGIKSITNLYAALQRDLAVMAESGQTGENRIGKNTNAVLKDMAEAAALERARSLQFTKQKAGSDKAYQKQMNVWYKQFYESYAKKLLSSEQMKELSRKYLEQNNELRALNAENDNLIAGLNDARIEERKRTVAIIMEESQLTGKLAKDYTDSDVQQLKSVIENQEQQLKLIDPGKQKAEYERINKAIEQNRNVLRHALLAWIDDPLKGQVKMKVKDNKWIKDLDENGKLQYNAVKDYVDLSTGQLRDLFKRAKEEHDRLLNDYQNNLEDTELPEYAKKLSNIQKKVKAALLSRGETIDNQYNIGLDTGKEKDGSRAARQEEIEAKKAYEALLNNLKEYFERRKQLINEAYLSNEMTTEEHNRQLENIDNDYLRARISMQQELLGEGNKFNEQLYIRDLENYQKVQKWMLKEGHHFQDNVRKDMEEGNNKILNTLIKQREERSKILLDKQYQQQVDKEMMKSFEKTGLFWGEREERTQESANNILKEMRKASADVYPVETGEYRKRLESNAEFGEMVKTMDEEQYNAFIILLQNYHDKVIAADKKFADERKRIIQQQWEGGGFENIYNDTEKVIDKREKNLSLMQEMGGFANQQEYFNQEQNVILQRVALEEWKYQQMYDLYKKNDATEEMFTQLSMERNQKMEEFQQKLLENYANRYQKMAEVTTSYGQIIGDGIGKIIAGEENAGKELIKNILKETITMAGEFAKRLVLQQTFSTAMQTIKQTQQAQEISSAYSAAMQEVGIETKKMTAIKAIAAGKITAESMSQPDSVATFGASGAARAAIIIGLVTAATAAALALVNSLFPNSTNDATAAASSKRLATGMLTYESGRYPVQGNDGQTYNAQYEPVLQTKIYEGGKGKAHFGIFSEKMPEMVVSGPTTKIIQENYPELINAIMTVEKHGRLKNAVPTYASGNVESFSPADISSGNPADNINEGQSVMMQTLQNMNQTLSALNVQLKNGIRSNINMYGKNGLKEKMDKADNFYKKNKINN